MNKTLTTILSSLLIIVSFMLPSADAIQPSFISGSVRNSFNNNLIPSSGIITSTGFSSSAPAGLFYLTVPPNVYSIIVSSPGFFSNIYSGIIAAPGQTFNADIWLTPASREISYIQGRVIALKTGMPVNNAVVVSSKGSAAVTDSNGSFNMSADAGITTLTASAKGFSSREAVDISLREYSIKQILFYLEDAPFLTSSVSGRIRNACTGESISNSSILSSEGKIVISSDGFYSLDTPSGLSTLIATAPGYQFSNKTADFIPFVSYTINFDLVPANKGFGKVTGSVLNSLTGEAIDDALIQTDKGFYTYTKNDGAYNLYTSTCSSFIESVKEGFIKTRVPVSVAYSTSVSKELLLDPLASVHGFIKDSDNQTLSGVDIYLEEDTAVSTTSGTRGFYRLDNITPGSYNITANHPCFQKQTMKIDLSSGQLLSENFFLNPNPAGLLYGTVSNSLTGMPVPDADLYTQYGKQVRTDFNGNYSSNLPSCSTSVTAGAHGYLSSSDVVDILENSQHELSFELTPCPLDFLIKQTVPGIFPYPEIFRIYRDSLIANDDEIKKIIENLYRYSGEITLILYKHKHLREKASSFLFESFMEMMTNNGDVLNKDRSLSLSGRVIEFLDEFSRHTQNPSIHDDIYSLKKQINQRLTD